MRITFKLTTHKSIIIGCGDVINLSSILACIEDSPTMRYQVVTVMRPADINHIILSIKPDLLLLSFKNNEQVINTLCPFIKEQQVPLICLNERSEKPLVSEDHILFSYPFDHLQKNRFLSSTIQAVFKLQVKPLRAVKQNTLADTAMVQSNREGDGNLSRYVMELDQKTAVLTKVKERIAQLYPRVDNPVRNELMSIVNSIKASANDSRLWDDFRLYFEQNNPNFLLQLAEKHPDLTPIDLKYCCYLKMNMSNDDIRNLLGINQESVRTHKYRLKKKMSLSPEEDLRAYLNTVDKNTSPQFLY